MGPSPPFSLSQQKFLALCPKFTAALSLLGSTYILEHVATSAKRRRQPYHRILFGMSLMDLTFAVKNFLTTWPIPADAGIYLASGTTETCTAAGFFGHAASLSSSLYNGSLTAYFLLTIRYRWFPRKFARRAEAWAHSVPLLVGWSTALAALPLRLFNPIEWVSEADRITCSK